MVEREYLERRIRRERRLAKTARSPAAALAHRQMEESYSARLQQITPASRHRGWWVWDILRSKRI